MNYFSINLAFLRKKLDKNQGEVATDLGFNSHSRYSNYETGKAKPEFDVLVKISKYYQVSIDDLINIDLSKKSNKLAKNITSEPTTEYTQIKKGLPLIPIEAAAGFGDGDKTVLNFEADYYNIPEFNKKADFLIRITGNSMYPKYYSGDIVACKKVPKDTFMQWGKVYVMDTVQGPLCKRVEQVDGGDDVLLIISDNISYKPFRMAKKEIRSLAIVVGMIRLE